MLAPSDAATASNRYKILGRIASGGMADIYVALATTEAGVERHVVLKRVLAERTRDEGFAQMFLDEARLSALLQHPNIAQVYDVGQLGGTYFYTMEYVHGEDLRHVLHALVSRRKIQLPVNLALYIATGALAALHHAHLRTTADGTPLHIVHRDVSPSNVMIGYEGAVKLLDFGVAKAAQRSTESKSGSIKGKVAYLSPEQIKGHGIDARSDVFALGIVLHEMLTGRRLYKRDTDYTTLMAITTEDVPPPTKWRTDMSPALEKIVMKALEKDPDQRYRSAAAMLEDIEALATSERHLMSANALARFMREQVGVRPEPWVELRAADPSPTLEITASNSTELTAGTRAAVTAEMTELQEQLDHARDLRATSVQTPTSNSAPMAAEPAPTRNRGVLLGVLASLIVGGALAAYILTRDGGAVAPPPPAPVAVVAPAPEPTPTPATPPPAPTPAPAPSPQSPAATIGELAAKADWLGVLSACAAKSDVGGDERRTCAIAACNTNDRDRALIYRARVSRKDLGAIDRACRDKGIALAAPASTPAPATPTTAKDPCKDPKYVEANPLKCM